MNLIFCFGLDASLEAAALKNDFKQVLNQVRNGSSFAKLCHKENVTFKSWCKSFELNTNSNFKTIFHNKLILKVYEKKI